MIQTVQTVPYDVFQREREKRIQAERIVESQKRSLTALQNENHWYHDVIFNPVFDEVDMRLTVNNTPREMRMGLTDEAPERKIYLPAEAEKALTSEKTAARHLKILSQEAGAFSYRTERDKETGNTRAILGPLPAASIPSKLTWDKPKRGGSTWEDGKRVYQCSECGSTHLVTRKQTMCENCHTEFNSDWKLVNTPDSHLDCDPPAEEEISNCPPTTVNTLSSIEELQSLPIWVCHRAKVPYNVSKMVRDFQRAKSNDPTTWTTYSQAQAIYEESQSWKVPFDGIGMMNNGEYTFIDLDHCRDIAGQLSELAQETIACIDSYTELSQSGTGVHIIAKGTIPKAIKKAEIELYPNNRFFVFTGNHLEGTPAQVEDRQEELTSLYKELSPPTVEQAPDIISISRQCTVTEQEVLEKARNARNGEKFQRLYSGDWSGYHSQSEADQALCKMLAYYADNNVSTIDVLFRKSQLYREKWERIDYREQTIRKAIAS